MSTASPRFSVVDVTTPKLELADALDAYARVGATGVGLAEVRVGDAIAAAAELVAARGFAVTGCFLSCSSILPPPDPTADGARHPELSSPAMRIAAMAQSMRRLAPLRPGSFYALSGPRGRYGPDEAREEVVNGLRELADVAAEGGSGVLLELFHSSLASWSYASSIRDGIEILDAVGRPNVALAVDIWHLDGGPDTLVHLHEHAARIGSVHIDDRREPTRSVRDRLLPGDGVADVTGILGAVDAGGYDGWYELEIISDDGTYGNEYPDSLWKLDPFELVSAGRAKFDAAWDARRAP